ncbi:MAG TPA: hypothetical protein VGM67_19575, partial [Gemmatimonadaceae bacterium]
TAILERDGVGSQDDETSASERWPEGLIDVTCVPGYLALTEVELAVVLMEYDNSAERLAIPRSKQECGDKVAFESPVLDALSVEFVCCFEVASLKLHGNGVRQPEVPPKRRSEIDHHLQMITNRPLDT